MITRARDNGYRALLVTVDTPVLGRRERDSRTGFSVPYEISHPALGHGAVSPHGVFELMSSSVTWGEIERLRLARRAARGAQGRRSRAEDARSRASAARPG